MSSKFSQTSVTGRDAYIVNKAMLYAIASIQSLPDDRQEWSDMEDMCAIVRAQGSPFTMSQVLCVESHAGRRPDLWPFEGDDLPNEARVARDTFNAACDALKHTLSESIRRYEASRHGGVEFIESGDTPTPEPEFVEMTPEDVAHIRSNKSA